MLTAVERQSPDIAQGVNEGDGLHKEQGAGDQGLMFGYATDETPELMPAPIHYAHALARQLAAVRKKKIGGVDFLRPDGKTQVTLEYENDVPVRIDAIVVSTQHDERVKYKQLREAIIDLVIDKALPKKLIDAKTKIHVNPTGRFVIGGPQGDCGLTGRKIIVDTYGGMGRHGGGAFSGKDPSKVDRSACYYARYIAKNVVASGVAKRCEVQIAYAIGVAQPVGVHVEHVRHRQGERRGAREVHPGELRHAPQGAHRDARPARARSTSRRRRTVTSAGASSPGRRPTAPRRSPTTSCAERPHRSRTATATATATGTRSPPPGRSPRRKRSSPRRSGNRARASHPSQTAWAGARPVGAKS